MPEIRLSTREFAADERGSGTMFGLFFLAAVLLLGGVILDAANAFRNREALRVAADAAAHAGAVSLARGESEDDVWQAARTVAAANADPAVFGRIFADPHRDVRLMRYDPATNLLSQDGTPNAVRVRTMRSAENANPVPTLLLRMTGQDGWNIAADSVAALLPTESCDPAAGIYARGGVALPGEAKVGTGVCLHGQRGVDIAGTVRFAEGAGLSMPDLAACTGRCDEMVSPGIAAASAERNLIMTAPSAMIADLATALADPRRMSEAEAAFFAARPFETDFSPLAELGIPVDDLAPGALVEMTPLDFIKLRQMPPGLVYQVSCADPAGTEVYGDVPREVRLSGAPGAPALRHAALLTDCPVIVEAGAVVEGALVVALGGGAGVAAEGGPPAPAFTAAPGARIGAGCGAAAQSMILTRGDLTLAADAAASNLALVVDGDLTLAAAPGTATHLGVGLHASGAVRLEGAHDFAACPAPAEDGAAQAGPAMGALLPELLVIRHVVPGSPTPRPDVPAPTKPKTIVVASN